MTAIYFKENKMQIKTQLSSVLTIGKNPLKDITTHKGNAGIAFQAFIPFSYQKTVDGQKEWHKHFEWYTISVFDLRLIEYIKTSFKENAKIHVEGVLQAYPYTKQTGEINITRNLVANQVLFIAPYEYKQTNPNPTTSTTPTTEVGDDEIMF